MSFESAQLDSVLERTQAPQFLKVRSTAPAGPDYAAQRLSVADL